MDLKSVLEEAIAATNRAFWDRQGFVPAEDSEEWEREYRRQFEQVKARHAAAGTRAAGPAPAAPAARPLPELSGTPEQKRWAAAIRADRLGQIREPPIRAWLARESTRASCRPRPSAPAPRSGMPSIAGGRPKRSGRFRPRARAKPRRRPL